MQTVFYIILGTSGISLDTNEVVIDLKPETYVLLHLIKP